MKNGKRVFIIAEAGVNHNGSLDIAKRMINAARKAGADAVKFQTFKAGDIATSQAPKAAYQRTRGAGKTQLEMLKAFELDRHAHKELMDCCKKKKILFLSSPFDLKSIDMLDSLGVKMFKIPSGEITNLPYLRKIGSLGKKIIMSTGMADLDEIKQALNALRKAGTAMDDITVLHCNTEYPAPIKDVNLNAMLTIAKFFDVAVGYSDHTCGIEVPIAAVALGATVIEKHFTLDKNMDGPDHKASIEPDEFKKMVEALRNIEKAMGSGDKMPSASEIRNKPAARKSIVAAKDIKRGEVFTAGNIATKRSVGGISPMRWDDVIGRNAKSDFKKNEPIKIGRHKNAALES